MDRVHARSTVYGRPEPWNSTRGVASALAWLMWQPRGCHVNTRADVALRWQPRWHTTSTSGRRWLGVELAGATRRDEAHGGAQKNEEKTRKLVRYLAAEGHGVLVVGDELWRRRGSG